jgi:hypothetical protein
MKERKTMKRLLPLLCAGVMAFTAASTWEGAVTTAPRGALPDEGYYAATNSFPRNTVVDIVNLETGKTIRVIVASGLDTPGLLATLSEAAAKSIGLQPRSIGRIRMTQPSDPIAFSRFTEGLMGSGDPDYDPEAMLEADGYGAYEDEDAGDLAEDPSLIFTPPPGQLSLEDPPVFSGSGEDYFSIVDVPGSERGRDRDGPSSADEIDGEEDPWDFSDGEALAGRDDDEDSPENTLYPIWAQGGSVGIPDSPEPAIPEKAPARTTVEASPQITTETTGAGSWASAWVTAPQNPATPPAPGTYDYSLVPAEKRPPADTGAYVIPPEAQVGPVAQAAPAEPSRRPDPVIDQSLFIESIENIRDRNAASSPAPVIAATPEAAPSPVPPRETLPEPVLMEPPPVEPAMPEPVIIVEEPPLPKAEPVAPPKVTAAPEAPTRSGSGNRQFSLPIIDELEKGKYYLQLGAYSKPDLLESSASKVGSHYPLSVQTAGSADKPIYRLILGPVNLGESGALMQRFKGSGYKDVFVRTY